MYGSRITRRPARALSARNRPSILSVARCSAPRNVRAITLDKNRALEQTEEGEGVEITLDTVAIHISSNGVTIRSTGRCITFLTNIMASRAIWFSSYGDSFVKELLRFA